MANRRVLNGLRGPKGINGGTWQWRWSIRGALMNCRALERHSEMIKRGSQEGAAWLITIKAMRKSTRASVSQTSPGILSWMLSCTRSNLRDVLHYAGRIMRNVGVLELPVRRSFQSIKLNLFNLNGANWEEATCEGRWGTLNGQLNKMGWLYCASMKKKQNLKQQQLQIFGINYPSNQFAFESKQASK